MGIVCQIEGMILENQLIDAARFLEWNRHEFSKGQYQLISSAIKSRLLEHKIIRMFKDDSARKCA